MYTPQSTELLSEAIQVARIRSGRPETRRELQCAARDPNIAGNCLTLARRAGLSLENRS